jgi:hypothetical protein
MPIPDDIREFSPRRVFREYDSTTLYWIRGNKVLYRHYPIRGADIESFRFYSGGFAKDRKNCYCTNSRLTGGNAASFRALNFAYATDGQSVWTMGGRIAEVDAESFMVCDDGVYFLPPVTRVPYGYAKDKARVYYYDFDGKPNWVRKALPGSFVSLNDGHFGKDEHFVFCGAVTLPMAKVERWAKIGGFYSKDDARVYYCNSQIKQADCNSFEFVPSCRWQLAKDKHRHYCNDRIVDSAEVEALLKRELASAQQQPPRQ